jgi:hypothetical protein
MPASLIPLAGEVGRNTGHFLSDVTFPLAAAYELNGLNSGLRARGQSPISLQEFVAQSRSVSSTPVRPEVEVTTATTQQSYRIETQAGITKITQLDPSGLATRSRILGGIPSESSGPGGFKTTTNKPLWEDGQWPFTPWYGLSYPMRFTSSVSQNQ